MTKVIADFHIHSKYSRAVSPDMDLEHLDLFSGKKGITVMGTGDFTHPKWFSELKEKLEPAEPGLYKLKSEYRISKSETNTKYQAPNTQTRFLLTVEISNIYRKNGRVRKVHNLIFAPSLDIAEKLQSELALRGNIASDGRPILGLDSKELLKIVLAISPECFFVPAHVWTPWFSVFGSMSGFDSLEECFDDLTPEIKAVETGLSSDPAMNWRVSSLDRVALISNSDSHSPSRIGREANVFDCELSYRGIVDAIINVPRLSASSPRKSAFLYTIEFYPEEGKYHYDGHRACGVSIEPSQTRNQNGRCLVCGRPLTIGVLNRVEQLADRTVGYQKPNAVPFKNIVPLEEIIGGAFEVGPKSKKVGECYERLLANLGPEFHVLNDASMGEIELVAGPIIAEGVKRAREGAVQIEPGSDGEYGKIKIFSSDKERIAADSQTSLL